MIILKIKYLFLLLSNCTPINDLTLDCFTIQHVYLFIDLLQMG